MKQTTLEDLHKSLLSACRTNLGVFENEFLCRSVGTLNPREAVSIVEDRSVHDALETLKSTKQGGLLVLNAQGELRGIFTERDYLLKVHGTPGAEEALVRDYMTQEPMTVEIDSPIAFVLNLMSLGGFRHVPIVDADGHPVGMLSVKDIIDFMVQSFAQELLDFEED